MHRIQRSSPAVPILLALLALALALQACAPPETAPASRGEAPLLHLFEQAARESGVPLDLLLAVAYSESRFSLKQGTSLLGGRGLMHLRQGATLSRAAALVGQSEEEVARSPEWNVRGAALVLRELAGTQSPAELRGWTAALARYSGLGPNGEAYASRIMTVLSSGARGSDDEGRAIYIPSHPELDDSSGALPPWLGRSQSALTPDYSGATWEGPACSSSSRDGAAISFVIIHTCQGGFAGCWSWLKGCNNVSAHYVVSSAGDIVQLVEEKLKAWHVGCLNSKSVGIEHEGYVENPDKWFTEAMYCASAKLVKSVCTRNSIPCDRDHVIGHNEANALYCHSDHTDPGPGWNWTKFMSYVKNGCGSDPVGTNHPQLTIKASIADIAGQERDACQAGTSKGIFDWWAGQEAETAVDVKNTSKLVAKDVEVGLWAEEPYVSVQSWEILSDASGAFKINDTDGMQKIAKEQPGQTFKLWLAAFAAGETKRVRLKLRAAQGSLGSNVSHPDLRAWVSKIGDGVYEKASFDSKPSKNLDNSQTQNGGDLRALVETDVLAKEICGDESDNDCNGTIDDGCEGTPPPRPLQKLPSAQSGRPSGCSSASAEPRSWPSGALLFLLLFGALLVDRRRG